MASNTRPERATTKRKCTDDGSDDANARRVKVARSKKCNYSSGDTSGHKDPPEQKSKKATSKAKPKKVVDEEELALREAFRRVRGRRGILQAVKDLPLDIVFEIFSRLEPGDLVSLARTSKDIRAILMRKSSEYIWRAARTMVPDLPPLPRDMSEPAYASLVFDTFCHECTVYRARHVDWESRLRLCADCLLAERIYINKQAYPINYNDTTLLTLYKHVPKIEYTGSQIHAAVFYHADTWSRMLEEVGPISRNANKLDEWEKKHKVVQDDAAKIRRFLELRADIRKGDLSRVRAERYSAIMAKLWPEVNWSVELELKIRKNLRNHKLVNQPRALTDRIWKNIEPELHEIVQQAKKEILSL